MDIQQASSSSSPCPPTLKHCKYEVFLSFRGEDTRKNFTDHLYLALTRKGINAFRDDENLQRGKTIREDLLQAIKDSRISVIIFSMNYASSTWCLDELAQAHECMKDGTQIVLPVFYGVEPSEVRKRNGRYGEAIAELAFRESKEKVDKWKTALTEVANQSGWHVKERHEAELIQEIVEDILRNLCQECSGASNDLVGIDWRLNELIARLYVGLDDVRMVGIWGMAGIGKTTLAEVAFKKLSPQFDGSCFLYGVREADEGSNLVSLQQKLLDDILGAKNIKVKTVRHGINLISQRLRWRKVLVVLDDVNKWEQLESLAGSPDWFGPGSRVIFTTRDERLSLKYGLENKPYRIKGLNRAESFKLLCTKAFDDEYPAKGYLELSHQVVTYCGGLPLALRVLGSFFHGRSVSEWQSALARLKETPDSRIMDKLQISFDGLEEKEKKLFLDIACFFKGKEKNYITKVLRSCDFFTDIDIELRVLKEKSLITIEYNDSVSMHDLLQEMGRNIVRQESPEEPSNWSRLWCYRDAYHVLENDTGTNKVKGIVLDSLQTKEECSTAEAFRRMTRASEQVEGTVPNIDSKEVHRSISSNSFLKMKRLRLLILWNLHCLQDLEFLSNELRYLEWNRYPFESLPSSFHPHKLVELHLSNSNIKQLWEGNRPPLRMLKVLNLSHSQNLIKTPDFSEFLNLEELILKECTRLHEVHQSIGVLERLVLLNLKDCKSLKKLPSTICGLKSLKNLILNGCPKLDKLPERLGDLTCLEVLDLGRGVADEQPLTRPWDFLLRPLQLLPWKDPSPVALKLPSLSTLGGLRDLNLSYCKLREGALPNDLGCFPLLESLNLSGNDFKSLPTSIGQLSKVSKILFNDCKRLQSLPNLPSTLYNLECRHCESLETIPESICGLSKLEMLNLDYCISVKSLPDLPTSLYELRLDGCASLETLPNNFSRLSRLDAVYSSSCKSLRTLPALPSGISLLAMEGCSSLEAPPDIPGSLDCDLSLSFVSCLKLTEKQDGFGWVKKYLQSIIKNKRQGLPPPRKLSVLMPYTGGGIPGWFTHVSDGRSLKVELPPYWFKNDCLGFSIFVVFASLECATYYSSKLTVTAWIRTENSISVPSNVLYDDGCAIDVYKCFNSDVFHFNFFPCDKSKCADCWNTWSHLEVLSTTPADLKVKYTGLRIVYEQDVEELSRWSGTSSGPPFHNVVSTNKRSHDCSCSRDSQLKRGRKRFKGIAGTSKIPLDEM